jgi:hypothetical protein
VNRDEEKDELILRLRHRLHIVEPVYRAAVAAHRNGALTRPGQHERIECLERAVDRAIDTERILAEGYKLSLLGDELALINGDASE